MSNLFLGFDGRIPRAHFWIGMLVTAAAELILMLILGIPFFPTELKPFSDRLIDFAIQLVAHLSDRSDRREASARPRPARHLCALAGRADVWSSRSPICSASPAIPKIQAGSTGCWDSARLVIGLAFLVELGFRRGTAGENQYGPGPARQCARPAMTRRVDACTGQRWSAQPCPPIQSCLPAICSAARRSRRSKAARSH